MLSFKEYSLLVESFDLLNKPVRLSPAKTNELLISHLKQKHANPVKVASNILESYSNISFFKYSENNENYLVFIGKMKTK